MKKVCKGYIKEHNSSVNVQNVWNVQKVCACKFVLRKKLRLFKIFQLFSTLFKTFCLTF